jgi:hypothetical protein
MASFPRSLASTVLGVLAVGLIGCPTPAPVEITDASMSSDTPMGAPLCSAVPTNNIGTSVGTNFEGFTLQLCDGTDFNFYSEERFCAEPHSLTVLSIAAEWCAPCREESRQLRDRIVLPYGDRGVDVVQVIVQNASYGPPDLALCNRWVTQHNLEGVYEVIDPTGVTSPFFPTGSLPETALIDETGRIVYREAGATPQLASLRSAIDRELTRLGR